MLNWDDILLRNSNVVTRESDGELVVVLPEQGKYVVLNVTGARMLQFVDGHRTLQEIATMIADEFKADLDQVRADVERFAESLIARDVLRVK